MEKYFSIGRAAKLADMTAETLRHYDRIGLVRPSKTDSQTGYRYYTQREIVMLNTVKALRCMDMPLSEIGEILSYDDFNKIVAALEEVERGADEKIAELNAAKEKARRARTFYEGKLREEQRGGGMCVERLPQRTILPAEGLEAPTIDNLWNYHRHFYAQLPPALRASFSFEDVAGIYTRGGRARMFAVCTRFAQTEGLLTLPPGRYLCADCTEEERLRVTDRVLQRAREEYGASPDFTVQLIVLTGILQWNYRVQVYLG